jgi:hypothetical protein
MSPLMVVGVPGTFVIVEPASAPKLHADAKTGEPFPPPLLTLSLPHPTQRIAKHNPIAIRISFLLFWLAGHSIQNWNQLQSPRHINLLLHGPVNPRARILAAVDREIIIQFALFDLPIVLSIPLNRDLSGRSAGQSLKRQLPDCVPLRG